MTVCLGSSSPLSSWNHEFRGEKKNTRPDCEIWLVWIDSFEKCLKDTPFFDRIKIQLKLVQVKGGCLYCNFLQNCNRAKFPLNRGSGRKGYTFRSTPPTPITTGSTTFFVGNPKKNRAPKPPKRHPGCGVIQGIGYTTNCQVIHRDLFLQNLEVTNNLWMGSLNHPQKGIKNCQVVSVCLKFQLKKNTSSVFLFRQALVAFANISLLGLVLFILDRISHLDGPPWKVVPWIQVINGVNKTLINPYKWPQNEWVCLGW